MNISTVMLRTASKDRDQRGKHAIYLHLTSIDMYSRIHSCSAQEEALFARAYRTYMWKELLWL